MNTVPIRPLVLSALLATAVADPAFAGRPDNWTDGELALLPAYCVDTLGTRYPGTSVEQRSPRADHWLSLMGNTFWAMHHYCWGLTNVRRAQAAGLPGQRKRFLIETAIQDYQFVLRAAPADFIVLPEILLRTGEAYELLGRYAEAGAAYAQSRAAKADYWPAYARDADMMVKYGQVDKARELIELGLKALPDEPELLSRRNQLEQGKGR